MATTTRLVQDARDAIDALESKLEDQARDIEDLEAAKTQLESEIEDLQQQVEGLKLTQAVFG